MLSLVNLNANSFLDIEKKKLPLKELRRPINSKRRGNLPGMSEAMYNMIMVVDLVIKQLFQKRIGLLAETAMV